MSELLMYFINKFIEGCKIFDLKKAEIFLFNANVEAKRLLQSRKELLYKPININVIFIGEK